MRRDGDALAKGTPAAVVIAGRELAQRLETDQARSLAECADALARLEPERGVASLAVGGGRAVCAGPDSFFSEACGLAMDGPVSSAELDTLEEFYRAHSCRVRVEICPLADASLFVLAERRYRMQEFHSALVRPLAGEADPPLAEGARREVAIECIAPAEYGRWVEICAGGFLEDPVQAAAKRTELLALTALSRSRFYLASIDGRAVGAAAWGERDGLALLYATSVLPEFRGRGVHAALIAARVAAAREAGCDLAAGVALAGSGSQRNFERAGFLPAYTKVVLVREWE